MSNLPTIEIDPEEMARVVAEMYDGLGPPSPSDPGLTSREYAEQWGLSPCRARARIHTLYEKGLIIKGQYPVYRPSQGDPEGKEEP